jgi:kumamolisin
MSLRLLLGATALGFLACAPVDLTDEAKAKDKGASSSESKSKGDGGADDPSTAADGVDDDDDDDQKPATALPKPIASIYQDAGRAKPAAIVRMLFAFRGRNGTTLASAVAALYDPKSPQFRHYLTRDQWMDSFAPPPADLDAVKAWAAAAGLTVAQTASNRLLMELTGPVSAFDKAFSTELHVFVSKSDSSNREYGTNGAFTIPPEIANHFRAVLTADLAPDTSPLAADNAPVTSSPPRGSGGRTPAQIAKAYGVDALYAQGASGGGVKLGIVTGGAFRMSDAMSFWKSFGIDRAAPTVIPTMEPPSTTYSETTLDVEWAGAIAPQAELLVYRGPDAENSSILYTFNEAIGLGNVSVITDSFAHNESAQPAEIRVQYDISSRMAAALGITVLAATGDSSKPDVPATSPYVTGVGGTSLVLGAGGDVSRETAWSETGAGPSLTFSVPAWQKGVVKDSKRAVTEFAASATDYWLLVRGSWDTSGGTSFSAPVCAGLMAVVDSYRLAKGKPVAGYLNPILYGSAEVQKSFRDITSGASEDHAARAGWDYATGWGAPNALGLATTLP